MLYIPTTIKRLFILSKYISFKKITNTILLVFSYLLSRFGIVYFKGITPTFISIETANYCNLNCPQCPVGLREAGKLDRLRFDLDIYKATIDDLKLSLQHVILYFQGEPLLNPKLSEFISYAHNARVYTSTSTNGQLLTDETAKQLVLSGLDKLIVSVDGATQETYESYRTGGNLDKTLEGIRHTVRWKKELKSATPLIEVQFIVFKNNEHQLTEMKRLVKSLGANKLTFKTAQLYDYEHGSQFLTSINKYARYKKGNDGKYRLKGSQSNRCWRMWSGAVVNASGAVLPCCFDKESEFSFGNVNQKPFSEVWHTKKASDFRASILQNRKQFEMCRNCTSK